ncbi:MAG: hypothetical protein HYZ58_15940 [Acidobacteria bacterium]|nr:hypothetical protein [Acidobacteriota bacterium]MBI3264616.1 hypothetical protein [Acidobacteriota bacterium]
MLRTNLATHPFYNERAVLLTLGLFAALVMLVSSYNLYRLLALSGGRQDLAARIGAAETRADELRRSAARIRRGIDARELAAISSAAREANAIIGHRTFSWTDLFNRFETTLPPDVRIVKVSPAVNDDGEMVVTIVVIARRVDDIDAFIEHLEGTGTFASMLSRREFSNDEGLIEATLEGRYQPGQSPRPNQGS